MNRKAYIVTNKRHVTIAAYIVPGEVHINITVCPPLNHEKDFKMEAAATKCTCISILPYNFIFFFQNINNKKDVEKKYLKNESVRIVQINFQIQTHFFYVKIYNFTVI